MDRVDDEEFVRLGLRLPRSALPTGLLDLGRLSFIVVTDPGVGDVAVDRIGDEVGGKYDSS
ncbi:hypothetical protein B0O80DRAFT_432453 [Mortierella sp. GBAus27b]|nr:hypothetical protein B0O80DRAFT_432453 [Mortierella sp. GBAus27b]